MVEEGLKKFLEANPTDFELIKDNTKVKCVLTGHEMPAREKEVKQYAEKNKKFKLFKKGKGVVDTEFDYSVFEPHIVPHKKEKGKLFCNFTQSILNKIPGEVKKHVEGKRFKRAKEEFEKMVEDDVSISEEEEDEKDVEEEEAAEKTEEIVFDYDPRFFNKRNFPPKEQKEGEKKEAEQKEEVSKESKEKVTTGDKDALVAEINVNKNNQKNKKKNVSKKQRLKLKKENENGAPKKDEKKGNVDLLKAAGKKRSNEEAKGEASNAPPAKKQKV